MDLDTILQILLAVTLLSIGVAYFFYRRSDDYKSKQDSETVRRLYCDKSQPANNKEPTYILKPEHISMEVFDNSKVEHIKMKLESGKIDTTSWAKHLDFLKQSHILKLNEIHDFELDRVLNHQINIIDDFKKLISDETTSPELESSPIADGTIDLPAISVLESEINLQLQNDLTVEKIKRLFEKIGYVKEGKWIENKMLIGYLIQFLIDEKLFKPANPDRTRLSKKFAEIFNVAKSDQIRKNIQYPPEGIQGVFCELFVTYLEGQ